MLKKFNPKKTKYLWILNGLINLFVRKEKTKYKIEIQKAKNILIIDPTLIGDIVMLTAFLRVLKNNNPIAKITLVCGKWAECILKDQNLVDYYIFVEPSVLNSFKNSILKWKRLKRTLDLINKQEYDFALEPRGDLRYILFMYFCNARRKISYNYTGGESLITDVILPSNNVSHLIEDKMFFLKSLGCRISCDDYFPRLNIHNQSIHAIDQFNLDNRFVIGIHPGASIDIKMWDDYDVLLEKLFVYNKDFAFLIFKGPGETLPVNKVIKKAKEIGAYYIQSETPLDEYINRLNLCNVVFCNDSGAGHLAASLQVPVFVIFGPIEPSLAIPFGKKDVFAISKKIDCKPCYSNTCKNNKLCLKRVRPEEVFEAFKIWYEKN